MSFPDGTAWNLCDGIIRGRYRNGRAPGEIADAGPDRRIRDRSWVTSNLFRAGHRIRLEISSSNFPRFDRNLNTGDPIGDDASPRAASQRVLHDATYPSRLILPVIPTATSPV